MDVLLISSEADTVDQVVSILSAEGLHPDILPSINEALERTKIAASQVILIDLDSVDLERWNLRSLYKRLGQPFTLGISRKNYHPELREAVQSGIFTALIKQPFQEELTFWITRIANSGECKNVSGSKPVHGLVNTD